MKKIGEGWQYTVYDLGNGRVRKKYNSELRTGWIILKDIIPRELEVIPKIPKYIPDLKRKALSSFKLLNRKQLPAAWLAHPLFVNELDYEQDRVLPLHILFEQLPFQDSKVIVDKFVVFNKKLIEIGVIDKFFHISKNFGQDASGRIVLMDIGELVGDRDKILKQLHTRIWAAPYKLKWIRDKKLRKYFVDQMDKHLHRLIISGHSRRR